MEGERLENKELPNAWAKIKRTFTLRKSINVMSRKRKVKNLAF